MNDTTLLFGISAILAVWMGINVLRIWSRNRMIRRLSLVQPVRCVVCGRLGTAIVTPRGLVAPPGWWRRWGQDLSFICSAACAKGKEA